MKIEIDLNDILGDEYGTESIQESVRRQVTDYLVNDFKKRVGKCLDVEIGKKVDEILKTQLDKKLPTMIEDLWDTKYVPTTIYGEKKEETTLRNELIKKISEEMVYKKDRYNSKINVFTENVDKSVESIMKDFRKDFEKSINEEFRKEALLYAAKKLKITCND